MLTHKHKVIKGLHVGYSLIVVGCIVVAFFILQSVNVIPSFRSSFEHVTGEAIDSLNGVEVFFNGEISHVDGRNVSKEGYNIGLKWQCVEFVKRYYYEYFNHVMPDAYGNAKDFYNKDLPDASYNEQRALVQYANPSLKKPEVNDIIVFDGHLGNRYGHIAIISKVSEDHIEIIQQNPGPGDPSREELQIVLADDHWRVMHKRCLGWLRIE